MTLGQKLSLPYQEFSEKEIVCYYNQIFCLGELLAHYNLELSEQFVATAKRLVKQMFPQHFSQSDSLTQQILRQSNLFCGVCDPAQPRIFADLSKNYEDKLNELCERQFCEQMGVVFG